VWHRPGKGTPEGRLKEGAGNKQKSTQAQFMSCQLVHVKGTTIAWLAPLRTPKRTHHAPPPHPRTL
jgi:hypothetical protein